MLKRANISWNARQLGKMIGKGTIKFDNAIQRGLVWDNKRKSLLIHSMVDGYPIPPFYSCKSDGIYDMLDGKQRCNAIYDFINDKFALTDLPEILLDDVVVIDISGKLFSELHEDIQDIINTYSLTIYYYEDITDDQITEMFARLNNGKPLTAIELTRIKAKSIDTIRKLSRHQLFNVALSEKAINRYTNEDIVIKSWVVINKERPCLDTKVIRPIMEDIEFSNDDIIELNKVFDTILECHKTISEKKENSKIAKRLITKTHLISITPLIKKCIDNNVDMQKIIDFILYFFSGTKSPTINDSYNSHCTSGSGHELSVAARLNAINDAWSEFSNKDSISEPA